MRTLVTGGIRSGKSAHAEALLGQTPTHYLATGAPRGDAEWQRRVRAHAERRPASWCTLETIDVASALDEAPPGIAVLIDDVGNWVTRTLGRLGAWDESTPMPQPPADVWQSEFAAECDRFVDAVASFTGRLVIVSSEVGLGLVSAYRSGRVFTDELGHLNQRIAAVCEDVVLVVSGCPLTIKGRTS